MSYEEIFDRLDAEPFRPFRIRMASGRTFDIRHPEMIRVEEHAVHVLIYSSKDERLVERLVTLGFSMMESLEPADAELVPGHDS